ncbi:MAG: Gfo/Idh/MocA family oxidoreductase [Puniceicoccales bacterium]|jgi:predicted dehydrogenase|nr:Gfo/Idh/MocA family oxidoreductase [Puniceicoccales bacterium]
MADLSSPLSVGQLSRRRFLQRAGMAVAAGVVFPSIIPARALGRDGNVSPSNRITVGTVGTGQGMDSIRRFASYSDVQVVAICDLHKGRREGAVKDVNNRYKNNSVKGYADFREMFAKAGLDAVVVAPPDHWHAIIAIAAARAGLDIYGEKPVAHTIAEGRAIANAVKQHARIWQTGSWQRSTSNFYQAVNLVRNGAIGKVSRVHVGTLATQNGFSRSLGSKKNANDRLPSKVDFDYDFWLGPAREMEYDSRFTVYSWRWILNFGGGNLMDWVGHHVDIAHWGMGYDETGPVKVVGTGEYSTKAPWDAEVKYKYECTYADGNVISVGSSHASGTKFFGEGDKWIYVDRGRLTASEPSILSTRVGADVPVYNSRDHWRNFIDGVKTRKETITPIEIGHRSASIGHLGHIAVQTGRTINWDPATETIKDDPGASALLSPNYRSPWVL